ncbi:hypothetical protein E2C01_074175 [Portunus trituberculatus]|uniref:Uncharacterized protein n=1 Tax=Portunus trituberculatus TaxID=210409 RepID=A0A5B7IFN9_PORTR|nr:hypothetical protein [Portunus trituberculatus]
MLLWKSAEAHHEQSEFIYVRAKRRRLDQRQPHLRRRIADQVSVWLERGGEGKGSRGEQRKGTAGWYPSSPSPQARVCRVQPAAATDSKVYGGVV